MPESLGVAVVGAGMAGKAHAAAFRTAPTLFAPVLPPIRFVSIGDVNADFGRAAADRFGYERTDSSWRAIAEADDIDVVSVVIANSLHREVVEGLLAAGKHVLCEKPLSNTLADARAMAAAADGASALARVGFTFRRTPGIAYIRQLIHDGTLGPVRCAQHGDSCRRHGVGARPRKVGKAVKLGVYTAVLHDRPLPEALDVIASLGLEAAEINAGGFLPPVHIPIDDVIASQSARDDYLGIFADKGVALAGLNANGNPLHPNKAIGEQHANDLRRAIRAAGALGQTRVVTMSGLPGGEPGSTRPNWIVNAWNSGALDVLDYQWDEVVTPFWQEIDALPADHGVKVAIEMHPQNIVFSPPTMMELIERTGATNIGAEMDPSHLFWQGMDPVAAVRYLGSIVVHAAAKDVKINDNATVYGVLDNRFRRLRPDEDRVGLGGQEYANEWPRDSAWDFVALGRGHDTAFWTEFIRALYEVDPEMAVNIEHEDVSLGRIEGLEVAAATLKEAAAAVR